jgi:hypothetical protein
VRREETDAPRPAGSMVPVAILGLIFLHGAAEAKLKGSAFSNGRNSALYTTAAADASLDLMRDTGANMVHVMYAAANSQTSFPARPWCGGTGDSGGTQLTRL